MDQVSSRRIRRKKKRFLFIFFCFWWNFFVVSFFRSYVISFLVVSWKVIIIFLTYHPILGWNEVFLRAIHRMLQNSYMLATKENTKEETVYNKLQQRRYSWVNRFFVTNNFTFWCVFNRDCWQGFKWNLISWCSLGYFV